MELSEEEFTFQILDLIYKNGGEMQYISVLNGIPAMPPLDTLSQLNLLISDGFVSRETTGAYGVVKITAKGKRERRLLRQKLFGESPEQPSDSDTNDCPPNTVSEKPEKKQKRITKLPKWLFPVAGGTIIIGLAQALDIFNGIFEFFTNICSLF